MRSLNSHSEELSRFWKGEILWDMPMSRYSTLRVGGPAEAIIPVTNTDDLKRLIQWLKNNNIDWWIVGRGSNILVPDNGLAGVTIFLEGEFTEFERIDMPQVGAEKTVIIRAGAGCLLSKLIHFCIDNALAGLEFAIGIPGSIGGAVVMNAGAWGNEIGNLLDSAILMNSSGDLYTTEGQDIDFNYREWGIEPNTLLLYANFTLKIGNKADIKAACQKFQELRKKNQPISKSSAGSFFKNPANDSAGRLIDQAGLKGHAIGGAKISDKHANFIINTGNASATDILDLMLFIQATVHEKFGIGLEPEVHILGDQGVI